MNIVWDQAAIIDQQHGITYAVTEHELQQAKLYREWLEHNRQRQNERDYSRMLQLQAVTP